MIAITQNYEAVSFDNKKHPDSGIYCVRVIAQDRLKALTFFFAFFSISVFLKDYYSVELCLKFSWCFERKTLPWCFLYGALDITCNTCKTCDTLSHISVALKPPPFLCSVLVSARHLSISLTYSSILSSFVELCLNSKQHPHISVLDPYRPLAASLATCTTCRMLSLYIHLHDCHLHFRLLKKSSMVAIKSHHDSVPTIKITKEPYSFFFLSQIHSLP